MEAVRRRGCITPWNFPIQNSFLSFASPLFAGNVVVIKPSEVTPASGELLRKISSLFPSGVATVIQGGGDVGAALVDARRSTRSRSSGRRVPAGLICEAAAKHLTPVVMELGGKDAAVVTKDVDVDLASSGILWGAFCERGSDLRFHRARLRRRQRRRRVPGSTAQEARDGETGRRFRFTDLQATAGYRRQAGCRRGEEGRVGSSRAGRMPDQKYSNGSLWYSPTVITDVADGMTILHDETFGPVLTIIRVRDEDEAIRRATRTA